MSLAQLAKVDDPRDPLDRARRNELIAFCKANGLYGTAIDPDMPAIMIRRLLRERGIHRIPSNPQPLGGVPVGQVPQAAISAFPTTSGLAEQGVTINADALLEQEFRASKPKPIAEMKQNELKSEAKRRGIKISRKDNLATLRGKLLAAEAGPENGKNPA